MNHPRTLHTVGHSNHEITDFIALLRAAHIDCVVDVRSTPASAYNPQFNQEPLRAVLERHRIRYLHFPEAFGARHRDPALHDPEGRVDFRRVQRSAAFRRGVERLELGLSRGYRIALMCSEGNPLECHRFSMIAAYLVDEGFEVEHLLRDGRRVDHAVLLEELTRKYAKKLEHPSLFRPEVPSETEQVYRLHNREVGWSVPEPG